ncbi:MAG: hypothetical protein ACOYYS_00655 [Chloroflexota bacterium]
MTARLSFFTQEPNTYKALSCGTALLYFSLFLQLMFCPGALLDEFGIARSASALALVRRTSMLMLGFSIASFLGRNVPPSQARQAMLLAISANMGGFAVMSVFGVLHGYTNASFLQAAAIETILAIVYFLFWLASRRPAMPVGKISAGFPCRKEGEKV